MWLCVQEASGNNIGTKKSYALSESLTFPVRNVNSFEGILHLWNPYYFVKIKFIKSWQWPCKIIFELTNLTHTPDIKMYQNLIKIYQVSLEQLHTIWLLNVDCVWFTDDFDPQKDDPDLEGLCSIVISLMQEHRQSTRNVKVKKLQIGFFLYRVWVQNNKYIALIYCIQSLIHVQSYIMPFDYLLPKSQLVKNEQCTCTWNS